MIEQQVLVIEQENTRIRVEEIRFMLTMSFIVAQLN